jgi:hypothetical protein
MKSTLEKILLNLPCSCKINLLEVPKHYLKCEFKTLDLVREKSIDLNEINNIQKIKENEFIIFENINDINLNTNENINNLEIYMNEKMKINGQCSGTESPKRTKIEKPKHLSLQITRKLIHLKPISIRRLLELCKGKNE